MLAEAEKNIARLEAAAERRAKKDGLATALNEEYHGGVVGRDLTNEIDVRNMVSEDPYRGTFTNNVARLQGFDAPAKLVSKEEFEKLAKETGDVIYRTVNPAKFHGKDMTAAEFASQIYKAERMELNGPGGRAYGDGMYVASSAWDGKKVNALNAARRSEALEDSLEYGNGEHKTLEMTWTRKPKLITMKELYEKWNELTPEQQKALGVDLYTFNDNTVGCALGYDGKYCKNVNYIVVWNRSILAVKNT